MKQEQCNTMDESVTMDQQLQTLQNIIKLQESVIAFQQESIRGSTTIIEQSNKREDNLIILHEKLYAECLMLKRENIIVTTKYGILQKYGL